MPRAAGVDGAARQRRRCRHALGQLLVAGPDPAELAADPRAARRARATSSRTRSRTSSTSTTAANSRRSRRGCSAPAWPRRRRRYAASGRGCDGSAGGAERSAARRRRRWLRLVRLRLAVLLLRREGLVELLLRRLAGPVGPDHRLLLRIALVAAAACRSACRSRRPSAAIAVRVDRRVAVHLFFRRQLPVGHRHLGLELLDRPVGDGDGS